MRSIAPAPLRGRLAGRGAVVAAWLAAGVWAPPAAADAPPPDETPPEVSIVEPKHGSELPAGTTKITVKVETTEDESGVIRVALTVDGKPYRTLDEEPWVFADIELSPGKHTLVANAENYDNLDQDSAPVSVTVPEPVPTPTPDAKADAKADAKSDAKAEAKSDAKPDAKAGAKAEAKATPKPSAPTDAAKAKDGCFASTRPRSLAGSGLALLFAVFAGLMLRRRPG